MIARPPAVDVPAGTRIRLDPRTKPVAPGVLLGGTPRRLVRLTTAGMAAFDAALERGARGPAARRLARRLTDANVAQPVAAGDVTDASSVTVVVPARDRAGALDRCLEALGKTSPVVVVDDGSDDPGAIAETCARHGARLVRREVNGGPAAARNTALAVVDTELVAFVDSDCVPPVEWVRRLAGHLADPAVGAVAPRIVVRPGTARSWWSAYASARSPLDMGRRAGRVLPMTAVGYVPTAALLVRREAMGEGFDERLRFGEDVDLVWRMTEAGWRVRYEPAVEVEHTDPEGAWALLRRRFRYGTSAAPLALRHPGSLAPVVLDPWPTATVVALLARRPVLAIVALALATRRSIRQRRDAGAPASGALPATVTATFDTFLALGRGAVQLAGPVVVVGAATRRGRPAVVALVAGPALVEWRRRRRAAGPGVDAVRFTLAHLADEVAYGLGVWSGCVRARTLGPVVPRVTSRVMSPGRGRSAGLAGSARSRQR